MRSLLIPKRYPASVVEKSDIVFVRRKNSYEKKEFFARKVVYEGVVLNQFIYDFGQVVELRVVW